MFSGQENIGLGSNLRNPKRGFFVFAGVLVGVLVLVSGSYLVWDRYFSEQANQLRNYKELLRSQQELEERMSKDIYGGKTPEETFEMFLTALKKEDIDLASKYFVFEKRQEQKEYFEKVKILGKWGILLQNLSLPFDKKVSLYDGHMQYESQNEGRIFLIEFIRYSNGIWKLTGI